MKKLLFMVAVFLLGAFCANAQAVRESGWLRLESDSKDFSIAVPSDYEAAYDEEGYQIYSVPPDRLTVQISVHLGKIWTIAASRGGATILVERYRCRKVKEALAILFEKRFKARESETISLKEFQGTVSGADVYGNFLFEMFVGNENTIYRVIGGARTSDNEALKYLLSSIRLNGGPLFAHKSLLKDNPGMVSKSISDLKETPFQFELEDTGGQSKADDVKRKPIIVVEGDTVMDRSKLAVLFRPSPRYTDKARYNATKGIVELLVTFGADGRVEKIKVVKGLGSGLTESVVRAARFIRFLPPEKDGKPVAADGIMKYRFGV